MAMAMAKVCRIVIGSSALMRFLRKFKGKFQVLSRITMTPHSNNK